MAERKLQRPKTGRSRSRTRAGEAVREQPQRRALDTVTEERDRLKAELEAARAEIERMRRVQAEVLDRIDWVIDSLDSLSE